MTRLSSWIAAGAASLLSVPVAYAAPPTIVFMAPDAVAEGTAITVAVTVTDPDGGTPTWSWDLDDDGVFGEATDEANKVIMAGTTDGDSVLRIGVEATDGVETSSAYVSISITNVVPTITSTPATDGFIRSEYRYEVTVDDPGGALDPLTYRLTSRPMGMEIADNVITWTPIPEQRGRTFPVILRVDDGDSGEAVQMWDILVAANRAPSAPNPMTPIERMHVAADEPVTLTVENGVDLDGDPLDYFFRLSRTSGFDTAALIGSGGIAEDTGATTSWTTDEPLEPGLWYWQVWVDDGMTESPRRFAQLVVGDGTLTNADSGPSGLTDGGAIPGVDAGTGSGDGGCAVGAPARSPAPAWSIGLLVAALVLRRRRVGA